MKNIAYATPKPRLPRNANVFLLNKFKEIGYKVEIETLESGKRRGKRSNPIKELYEDKKFLTKEEWHAAEKYQTNFHRSLEYDIATSSIFRGMPRTSENNGLKLTGKEIACEARRYIDAMRSHIIRNTTQRFKKHQRQYAIDRKYSEILCLSFEFEFCDSEVAKALNTDSRTLEARQKRICEIMLDFDLHK